MNFYEMIAEMMEGAQRIRLQNGMTDDSYALIKRLGEGSFGQAWLIRHKDTGTEFVGKCVDFNSDNGIEFAMREVDLLKSLKNVNIVQYISHDLLKTKKGILIIMEFCGGGDLSNLVDQHRRKRQLIPADKVCSYSIQILDALQYLHSHNPRVLHRDLKPANIFLTADQKIVKLGDFGVSRSLENTLDQASTLCGTPQYLSPEIMGEESYNHKGDIWAAGCCIYELIALDVAVDVDWRRRKYKVREMPKFRDVELVRIVRDMLQLDQAKRSDAADILSRPYVIQARQTLKRLQLLPEDQAYANGGSRSPTPLGNPIGGAANGQAAVNAPATQETDNDRTVVDNYSSKNQDYQLQRIKPEPCTDIPGEEAETLRIRDQMDEVLQGYEIVTHPDKDGSQDSVFSDENEQSTIKRMNGVDCTKAVESTAAGASAVAGVAGIDIVDAAVADFTCISVNNVNVDICPHFAKHRNAAVSKSNDPEFANRNQVNINSEPNGREELHGRRPKRQLKKTADQRVNNDDGQGKLRGLGYEFNEYGELRDSAGNGYRIDYNTYPDVCEGARIYLEHLLENQHHMQKKFLPLDRKEHEVTSYFYATEDVCYKEKLLVLVHGAGNVRVGQWSRELIVQHSIEVGSQIPWLKAAKEKGYAVIMANTNYNTVNIEGVDVPISYNDTPLHHLREVWRFIMTNCKAPRVAFFAHSDGGSHVVNLASWKYGEFSSRTFGVAFSDARFDALREPAKCKKFFSKHSRNYVPDSSEPNTELRKDDDISPKFSAGNVEHSETANAVRYNAMAFLEQEFEAAKNNSKRFFQSIPGVSKLLGGGSSTPV